MLSDLGIKCIVVDNAILHITEKDNTVIRGIASQIAECYNKDINESLINLSATIFRKKVLKELK